MQLIIKILVMEKVAKPRKKFSIVLGLVECTLKTSPQLCTNINLQDLDPIDEHIKVLTNNYLRDGSETFGIFNKKVTTLKL